MVSSLNSYLKFKINKVEILRNFSFFICFSFVSANLSSLTGAFALRILRKKNFSLFCIAKGIENAKFLMTQPLVLFPDKASFNCSAPYAYFFASFLLG